MKQIKIINPVTPKWEDIEKDFSKIVKSKNLTTSDWTKKVEDKIKKIHKCKYCLLTSSGTTAYHLLLSAALFYNDFDGIEIQDFTWDSIKIITEQLCNDTTIEYIDVDKNNYIANYATRDGVLFVPTMTFGNVISYNYKNTIYDSSHCIGCEECNGRGLGEILSFSPSKMITGCEGGAIITNNKKIYEYCLKMRRYIGRISEFNACFLYHNFKNVLININIKNARIDKYLDELCSFDIDWQTRYATDLNEFVITHKKINNKVRKELEKIMEIRLRYKPTSKDSVNAKYIYNHQLVLPITCSKREQNIIINKLKELLQS